MIPLSRRKPQSVRRKDPTSDIQKSASLMFATYSSVIPPLRLSPAPNQSQCAAGSRSGLFTCTRVILALSMAGAQQLNSQKTFYLETFGCQMNVHDSEKVIGTLLHEGYRQVETVEEADLILYNTCSIRDKAEQKVFYRLADYKKLQAQGKTFGVL